MSKQRRSVEGIMEDILREASKTQDATGFQLVGSVHLSWRSWKEVMPTLIKSGLIAQKGNFYVTTEKGLLYLHHREQSNKLIVAN